MTNIQQQKQSGFASALGKIAEGRVVDNLDPEGLGRVRVEILGKTDNFKPEDMPWLDLMTPLFLGGSAYSHQYAVPQINTQVIVLFTDDKMTGGYVIGSKLNRKSNPNDPAGISEPYKHPTASEHLFTEPWDSKQEEQTSFSMDFTQDYPHTWGWVDNAKNWFRTNMAKRFTEFVTNGQCKLKTYSNGDTVLHITGNMKVVIDKDCYVEIRGNKDTIIFKNNYEHTIGQRFHKIDKTEVRVAESTITDQGSKILEN